MKNLRNRLKKKLRGSKGFTLVEMTAAVLILVLLVLILNTGLDLAVKSYRTMTAESETELLMSSLSDAIYDELRYARDINADADYTGGTPSGLADTPDPAAAITGNLERYTSVSFGRNTTLSLQNGQLYASGKRLLAAGAYGNGDYSIEQLEITYDKETCVFTVKLTVGGVDNIKAATEFKIRPLNSIKPENDKTQKGGSAA